MNTLTFQDLMRVERVSSFALCADKNTVLLLSKIVDLAENKYITRCSRLDISNGNREEIEIENLGTALLSPDGLKLAYTAKVNGHVQLFVAEADGSNARQITSGAGGVSALLWAPDNRRMLFTRSVYDDAETQKMADESEEELSLADKYKLSHPKASVRTADALLYRHWDSWTENRHNHIFLADTVSGDYNDITVEDWDCPPIALGATIDYDFSPDGNEIVFVANPDKVVALSTNNSIYTRKIDGIRTVSDAKRISVTDACDTHPRYWGNDRIVYLAMEEPGYEADYNRIKIYDKNSGKTTTWLSDCDRSPDTFRFADDENIIFSAQDFAWTSIYRLNLKNGELKQLTRASNYKLPIPLADGRILCAYENLNTPANLVLLSGLQVFEPVMQNGVNVECSRERREALTHFEEELTGIDKNPGEFFWFKGDGGEILQGCFIKAPNFDPNQKYPLIVLIHGGPQGAFSDDFHYRWNAQLFAAQGACVCFCNPRGSTGYGRKITQEISGDWGGKCHNDIMLFVNTVVEKFKFIDPERVAAAGASFGGYSINWILGHTDRFKALVSHDGIFNTEMAAYTTEELWFNTKEFGGLPYEKLDNYRKPSPHLYVKNFKTPTLVIQGDLDFRCFTSEGVALFTALQYKGVESRLVYFTNEGHWVLQPANSQVWYEEVVGWMMKFIA